MKKATSLLSKIALGGLAFLTSGGAVLAESYEDYFDTYSTYDYTTTSDSADLFATMFTGGFAILYICIILLACIFFAFNVWMIVDVLKRTEAQMPNRTLWMVLLIGGMFLGFGGIAAIVYYFAEKRKLDKK